MESISPPLKIAFSNITVRPNTGGAKMLADVEGNLIIYLGKNIFLDEEYILLLELSIALMKWVNKVSLGKMKDFYYESMDYEDKPILAFLMNDDGTWRISSVWENLIDCSHLPLEQLLQATNEFTSDLTTYLKTDFSIDLSPLSQF